MISPITQEAEAAELWAEGNPSSIIITSNLATYTPTSYRFTFSEFDTLLNARSRLTGWDYSEFPAKPPGVYDCSSAKDPLCSKANLFTAVIVLPHCSAQLLATDICLSKLEISDKAGQLKAAVFDHEIASPKVPASVEQNYPQGGGVSVFSVNENSLGEPSLFAVGVKITYTVDFDAKRAAGIGDTVGVQIGTAAITGFEGQVIPINYETSFTQQTPCLWKEGSRCAVRKEFSSNQTIALTTQMDNRVSGWLFGRMKQTNVTLSTLSPTTNLLRVEAEAIDVPTGYADVTAADLSKNDALDRTFKLLCFEYPKPCATGTSQGEFPNWQYGPETLVRLTGGSVRNNPNPDPSFKDKGYASIFEQFLTPFPIQNSQWRLIGLSRSKFRAAKWPACFDRKDKFFGVVTTNAMIYDPSPPEFIDSSLVYRVSGAHKNFQNEVFKGSYDLALASETARCLYKFSSAPIKASVSITSGDGTQQNVATEVVGERGGFLTLSAKNFTFSSPVIRFKLSQDAPAPVVAGSATPAPKASMPTQVKKTVTCVKGKTKKIVSGVNPNCPSGYKKVK